MAEATFDPERIKRFCARALQSVGMSEDDARIAAEVLVTADIRGTKTHGTLGLRNYIRQMREGGADPRAEIEVVSDGPTWAIIDGHAGMGVVTSYKSARIAIEKARQVGVGIAAVRNSNHFAAANYFAMMCADEGMIGLSMSSADISMTAPGAAGRVIGNNPFAYAVPTGGEPMNLDIATAFVAGGKVHAAVRDGRSVPLGWITDKDGNPTTDPDDYEKRDGAMVPMSGHKGFAFALLIEALSGALSGGGIRDELTSFGALPERPSQICHFFLAINVGAMVETSEFTGRMDRLVDGVRNSRRMEGVDRIYTPGEMEHEREEYVAKHGIALDHGALNALKGLAADLGIEDEGFWI